MASIFLNAQGFDVDIPDDFETLKKLLRENCYG
jgi:hypothetical protein